MMPDYEQNLQKGENNFMRSKQTETIQLPEVIKAQQKHMEYIQMLEQKVVDFKRRELHKFYRILCLSLTPTLYVLVMMMFVL